MRLLLMLIAFPILSQAACLPEGPKNVKSMGSQLLINMRSIEEATQRFETLIARDLPMDHNLVIQLEPQNPRVNAEIFKTNNDLVVSVWGGMLGHPVMSSDVFLLLLCHEIGHFLGGPPLKSRNGWSSTEGQADYYSSGKCLKSFGIDESAFLKAALSLTQIYAEVTNQRAPTVDRCDETVVERTNYGYPSVQCRLDTLISGWKKGPRPKCWFLH